MAKLKSSISGILTVVSFLVLASLAATWYGGGNEQNAELDKNTIYQKARVVIGAVLSSSQKLADFNLKRNIGVGQKIKEELDSMDLDQPGFKTPDITFDSWGEFKTYLTEEWQEETVEEDDKEEFFSWEKDEISGNMIITFKNGQQYNIPMLSKWFNKK